MEVVFMLTIIGLSVALVVCLLSGGVEVRTNTSVKIGGKVYVRKRKRVEGSTANQEGNDETNV